VLTDVKMKIYLLCFVAIAFDFKVFALAPCGIVKLSRGLIIGGKEVKRHAYPWLVALHSSELESFFCAGSIVSTRHVVSAAHCFQKKQKQNVTDAKTITIHLGRINLEDDDIEMMPEMERNVNEIVMHRSWNYASVNYHGDIAILVVDKPIRYSLTIQPVCLPSKDEALAQKAFIVS